MFMMEIPLEKAGVPKSLVVVSKDPPIICILTGPRLALILVTRVP